MALGICKHAENDEQGTLEICMTVTLNKSTLVLSLNVAESQRLSPPFHEASNIAMVKQTRDQTIIYQLRCKSSGTQVNAVVD